MAFHRHMLALADPPLLENWLFENPWPLTITLAAIAIALLLRARRMSGNPSARKSLLAALVAAMLAASVFITATLITTDRERVLERTRTLVALTAPLDVPRLRPLFDATAVVTGPGGKVFIPAGTIFDVLEQRIPRYAIRSQSIRNLEAEAETATRATTEFDLITDSGSGGGGIMSGEGQRVFSRWRIQWQRDSDGEWRIIEIEWLELNKRPPSGL